MKEQYIKNVQQALTLHEEEARKSLVNDLDQGELRWFALTTDKNYSVGV